MIRKSASAHFSFFQKIREIKFAVCSDGNIVKFHKSTMSFSHFHVICYGNYRRMLNVNSFFHAKISITFRYDSTINSFNKWSNEFIYKISTKMSVSCFNFPLKMVRSRKNHFEILKQLSLSSEKTVYSNRKIMALHYTW